MEKNCQKYKKKPTGSNPSRADVHATVGVKVMIYWKKLIFGSVSRAYVFVFEEKTDGFIKFRTCSKKMSNSHIFAGIFCDAVIPQRWDILLFLKTMYTSEDCLTFCHE